VTVPYDDPMANDVPAEAEALLTSEPLTAHLATCRRGRPHVAPLWYRYEDGVVELVTTGAKLRNVRENPKVALSVQKDEGGRATWMVTLLGTATVVDDREETRTATRRINRKYGVEDDAWEENVLVRVDVGSASYRTYGPSADG
jgi:nitroimidazol reductase NimA-like FMN-containing flavoprotein (pyridoxamine 5'-phosphate oxidase superfamily)